LAALDATTGALKWKQKTTDTPRPFVAGAPGVDAGRVTVMTFKSGTWGLANYDATTGAFKWSQTGAGPAASAELLSLPACDGEVITESGAPGLSALSTTDATPVWGRSLATYTSLTATCADSTVITNGLSGAAGAAHNDVQVLRASNGSLVVQYPKAAGQLLRIYAVLRNATTLYFLTDKGVTSVPAP
ncbi:MAG TPA: PQQ-binding-like beta-propeller repeat protein, partial [Gemmatimonadaceae bacterium]